MAVDIPAARIVLPSRVQDRRLGRFSISLELIETSPETVRAVMGRLIVLHAEKAEDLRIDYTAICPEFAEVGEGVTPPVYSCFIERAGAITWQRRP